VITYKDIDGYFGYGKLYEEVIDSAKNNDIIVELGSFKGRSTSYLLELANKSKKQLNIYAIDHFSGSEEHEKIDYYPIFNNNISTVFRVIYPGQLISGVNVLLNQNSGVFNCF
jgi:hypothetical protein